MHFKKLLMIKLIERIHNCILFGKCMRKKNNDTPEEEEDFKSLKTNILIILILSYAYGI